MTEAVHVAAAIRGGASLVHGVQMRNHATKLWHVTRVAERAARSGSRSRHSRRNCRVRRTRRLARVARAFDDAARSAGLHRAARRAASTILQINVGKLCNQTCRHCHVDAGPDRREMMTRETCRAVHRVLARARIPTVDITGGAPELNPNFRWLVEQARALGRHVIDRCNLTVLLHAAGRDLPDFLARTRSSRRLASVLPRRTNTDAQRGDGVFDVDRGAAAA